MPAKAKQAGSSKASKGTGKGGKDVVAAPIENGDANAKKDAEQKAKEAKQVQTEAELRGLVSDLAAKHKDMQADLNAQSLANDKNIEAIKAQHAKQGEQASVPDKVLQNFASHSVRQLTAGGEIRYSPTKHMNDPDNVESLHRLQQRVAALAHARFPLSP
jgi:hypothetical protein